MLPANGSVMGVDVGYSATRKSSSACRIDWTESEISFSTIRFRSKAEERSACLRSITDGKRLQCVALDGPVRNQLDEIGRYRTAERLLTRQLQPHIGKPGQSSAPVGRSLNRETNTIARALLDFADIADANHVCKIMRSSIVEAFPNSFLGLMLPSDLRASPGRGARSDAYYQRLITKGTLPELLRYLIPGRKLQVDLNEFENHDDRAGIVCALTALCVANNTFTAVGDEDGWIVLPPMEFIQTDLWTFLERNAEEHTGSLIVVGS